MRDARRLRLARWALAHFTAFPAAVGAASGLEEGDKRSKHGYYAFIEVLPKSPARECEQIGIPGHKAVGLAGDQIDAESCRRQILATPAGIPSITPPRTLAGQMRGGLPRLEIRTDWPLVASRICGRDCGVLRCVPSGCGAGVRLPGAPIRLGSIRFQPYNGCSCLAARVFLGCEYLSGVSV
jgi:hypothetical protein